MPATIVPVVVNNDAQQDNMFQEEVVEEGDQALAPQHLRQASPKVSHGRRVEEQKVQDAAPKVEAPKESA